MPPGQLVLFMPVNQHAEKEQIILIIKGKLDDAAQQKAKRSISRMEEALLGISQCFHVL